MPKAEFSLDECGGLGCLVDEDGLAVAYCGNLEYVGTY